MADRGTTEQRLAALKAEREKRAEEAAKARAASDPMLDPTNRPTAEQDKPGYIKYYGWIGGASSGRWKLYETPEDSQNAMSAAQRAGGGTTQATFGSAVGANNVVNVSTAKPAPGTNVTGVTGNQTAGNQYTTVGGFLLFNGKAFSGTYNGKTYKNGKEVVTDTGVVADTSGNKVIDTPGSQNLPFTGSALSQNLPFTGTPEKQNINYTATDGKTFTTSDAYTAYQSMLDAKRKAGESAFDMLRSIFAQYGMGALVDDVIRYKQDGLNQDELLLKLRTESDAYKKRFAANAQRVAKGLTALDEATYVALEDKYQNIMRNYGMPAEYYTKGELGAQPGFEKFIANDISAPELEDRIQTAYNRVINAAPEVSKALKQLYPNINNGDILAYALDPQQALNTIKRKVSAAEIGGAALQAGLGTSQQQAELLQQYGVTQAEAQQKYQTIGGGLQRGSELASIYAQSPYTQTTAEQEVFGIPGATQAQQQRKKLIGLERATFGAQTGAGGALEQGRAGAY